jgi:hypothetical protein
MSPHTAQYLTHLIAYLQQPVIAIPGGLTVGGLLKLAWRNPKYAPLLLAIPMMLLTMQ